jgi:hypothetical protein
MWVVAAQTDSVDCVLVEVFIAEALVQADFKVFTVNWGANFVPLPCQRVDAARTPGNWPVS